MDQRKADSGPSTSLQPQNNRLQDSNAEPRQGPSGEVKDPAAAKKVQKADREKLRRDRMNEHFFELGNILDPNRPKNDKTTVLTDTIQILHDLTSEVTKLKAEYAALSEESRELIQEKNELREEKGSLKTDIENLNAQYPQKVRLMYPWAAVDPSLVIGPTYPYPVPMSVPQGPMPIHPSFQHFPFFRNQNPASCSTFIPYQPPANSIVEPHSIHYASSSHVLSKHDSKSKSSEHQGGSNPDKTEDSNDVATELELKMPGSSSAQQDLTPGESEGKQRKRKEKSVTTNGNSSSKFSSSQALQDSSSTSAGDNPRPDKTVRSSTSLAELH